MSVSRVVIDVATSAREFLKTSSCVLGQHIEILERFKALSGDDRAFLLNMAERLSLEIEAAITSCKTVKKSLTKNLEEATSVQYWQYEQICAVRNSAGSCTEEEEEAYRFITAAMETYKVEEVEAKRLITSLQDDVRTLEQLYDRAVIMLND